MRLGVQILACASITSLTLLAFWAKSATPTEQPGLQSPQEQPFLKASSPSAHDPSGISLIGRNLVIAGDSNDERFFLYFCRRLTGEFNSILHTTELVNPVASEYHGKIRWPTMASVMTCHDRRRNISAAFVFHQGLYSIPPQPTWYLDFAHRRMRTHYPNAEGKRGILPITDQARWIWPQVVLQLLPKRENILLLQSSMWDSVAVLEGVVGTRVSLMREAQDNMTVEVGAHISAANLSTWGWLTRAEDVWSALLQGFQENGLEVVARLWRTNPDCPRLVREGSAILNPLSRLYAEAVKDARASWAGAWSDACIVDLRGYYVTPSPSQCDRHFTKQGWEAYWTALSDCMQLPTETEKGRLRFH